MDFATRTRTLPNEPMFVIGEYNASVLPRYPSISIAFEARERIVLPFVRDHGHGLRSESLGVPFVKNYDAIAGSHPTDWMPLLSNAPHAILIAQIGDDWIGGAVVLCGATKLDLLDGREDVGLLWDLRVAEAYRGCGVGTSLFDEAQRWSVAHACREMRVETQDVNAAAARFYVSRGCTLLRAVPEAYPEAPDETLLLFEKTL